MGCIEKTKLGLRGVQWITALVAFSAAGYLLNKGASGSQLGFMTFTGVTAWLLTTIFMAVFCLPSLGRVFSGKIELIINGLYGLFWMAASAAITAIRPNCEAFSFVANSCNASRTAEAFGWLSFLLWLVSIAVSVLEIKQGSSTGTYGGERNVPPTATTAYSASV